MHYHKFVPISIHVVLKSKYHDYNAIIKITTKSYFFSTGEWTVSMNEKAINKYVSEKDFIQ